MMFSSKATARRLSAMAAGAAGVSRAVAGAVVFSALLASCGGGTSQYDPFVPKRLLVFGDDNSVITSAGQKYSVNGVDENGAIACLAQPIWVQSMASYYGFTFAECNPTFASAPQARMLALPGAKVNDIAAQVEAQVAAGGFRDKDLATMLGGGNDLIELFELRTARSEADLIAEAGARGARLATVVNRLVGLGVKVIVSDLYDMALTPYATALQQQGADTSMLTRLTTKFNEQLGVNVVLDGRFVGLVQAQLQFQAIQRLPSGYGFTNISTAVCAVPVPDCTTATLVTDAVVTAYLWAGDRQLSPAGSAQLASLALARAQRNPF